jgi:hypothetical protein
MLSADRVQILAFDGGGLRGLFSAHILACLQQDLGVTIHDHFDLITGTSAGGLCTTVDVPWVRVLSVHAEHQVLIEGLAQVVPLFVLPDNESLIARFRVDHYLQLIRAELHIAINSGASIEDCVSYARGPRAVLARAKTSPTIGPKQRPSAALIPLGVPCRLRLVRGPSRR